MTSVDGVVTHGISQSARNCRQNRISEKVCIRVVGCPVVHLNFFLWPNTQFIYFSVDVFSFAIYLKRLDAFSLRSFLQLLQLT